jgi:feruloyl esterase
LSGGIIMRTLGVLAIALCPSGAAGTAADRTMPLSVPSESGCARASSLMPAGAVLEVAESVVPAPGWTSPSSPTSPHGETVRVSMCRLAGSIDGDIGFEIWLPHAWNGRLLGAGVGGEAGYYNYADLARGVEQGFVSASSDAGHERGERWIDNPRKVETYSHLAYHRLTEVAKAVATAYYGQAPAFSYFIGCSGGGRQGLRELQLYPRDYDGALIGAPGLDVPLLAARLLHVHLAQQRIPGGTLSAHDWDLIAAAATRRCDAADGLEDGVIADPRACEFTVRELLCRPGQKDDCLTAAKVRAAEAIIAPLTDAAGLAYDHGLLPGNSARPGGLPPLPAQMFGDVVYGDPAWDPATFDIGLDLPAARAAFPAMDARQTDLGAFAARGGKLLLYHGWADASVQPQSTIAFFEALRPSAKEAGQAFARLYMVPGMQHCRGGAGTDSFGASEDRAPTGRADSDMLAALITWVEEGQSPDTIVARRLGVAARGRPLCPYPQQARYRGTGDPDQPGSHACGPPPVFSSTSNLEASRPEQAPKTIPGRT